MNLPSQLSIFPQRDLATNHQNNQHHIILSTDTHQSTNILTSQTSGVCHSYLIPSRVSRHDLVVRGRGYGIQIPIAVVHSDGVHVNNVISSGGATAPPLCWKIYRNVTYVSSIVSTSLTPSTMTIGALSLNASTTYTTAVTVSAFPSTSNYCPQTTISLTILVGRGSIIPIIAGWATQTMSAYSPYQLDAKLVNLQMDVL